MREPRPLAQATTSIAFLLLAWTGACGREAQAPLPLSWRMLDSSWGAPWNPMADSMVRYRIEIRTSRATDTIDGVSEPWLVTGDTAVVAGVRVVGDEARRQLFRYSAATRELQTWPVPEDVWYFYTDLAMSPDGRYLAYVAQDSTGTHAVVMEISTGRIMVRGPSTSGCDCDVDMNHARWFPPDRFEIAVAGADDAGGWLYLTGHASDARATIDTLNKEPDWHDAIR